MANTVVEAVGEEVGADRDLAPHILEIVLSWKVVPVETSVA